MRDDDERVLPLFEVALKPDDGMQVEVVRRLVQQQQPRLAEQRAREGDAHAPAAREAGGSPVLLLLEELQPAQYGRGARLGGARADLGEQVVHLVQPFGDRAVLVELGLHLVVALLVRTADDRQLLTLEANLGADREVLGLPLVAGLHYVLGLAPVLVAAPVHRRLDVLLLLEQCRAPLVRAHHHLQRGNLVGRLDLLLDEQDVHVGRDGLADLVVAAAANGIHQRRLATSVRADEAVPAAVAERELCVQEE